jgi:hypothetical protein
VHRVTILLRVDGNRAHAQFGRRTENPNRDFATVCRQKFLAGNRHGWDGWRGRLRRGGFHGMKVESGHIKLELAIGNLSKNPFRSPQNEPRR